MVFDKRSFRLKLLLVLYFGFSVTLVPSTSEAAGKNDLSAKTAETEIDKKNSIDPKIVARAKYIETSFDFGTVTEGKVVSHVFDFKNIGNTDYIIQRLVTGCGCTAASSSTEPIAPDQSGFVKIDFDTSGFSGQKTKVVRVYSNDIDKPELSLTLSGNIQSDVVLNPATVIFEDMVHGISPQPKEFSVDLREGSGLKLASVSSYSKFLKIEAIGAGQEVGTKNSILSNKFKVIVSPEIPVGELRDRILVNLTKGKETSSRTVPVLGRVSGAITLSPPQVSFGIIEGSNKVEKSISLSNRGSAAVEILSITSDTPAISPSFAVVEPGKTYTIKVLLDPSLVKSDLRALIEIKTSNIEEPLLYLSIFGVMPPKLDF